MKNLHIKFLDKENDRKNIELINMGDFIVFRIESETKSFDIELNIETATLLKNILIEML